MPIFGPGKIRLAAVVVTATILGVVVSASSAAAQDKSRLGSVNQVAGQVVFIEPLAGRVTAGRVESATDDVLVVHIGGIVSTVPVAEIRRVYLPVARDSVKNGAWIGAGAGAFMGAFACQGASEECSIAGATLGSAAVFAALGAWVDHRRKGRTVIYQRR